MQRLFFGIFVLFLALPLWSKDLSFSGRVALDKTIASFGTESPVAGTLYLLTGSAGSVTLLSEEPFAAEVDFVEAQWLSEQELFSSHVLLAFDGSDWATTVVARKPRKGFESLVYPYRKFQVAAVFDKMLRTATGNIPRFRVIAIPLLF
jgi:hypothetical protein